MTDAQKRILAVDDNRMGRLKVVRALEREGYEVEQAEGGRQALEMLAGGRFDLVMLDILMPEVDGFQVLREMKADPRLRSIPIIVVSAVEEAEDVQTAMTLGATDFLNKPIDRATLMERVNQVLAAC